LCDNITDTRYVLADNLDPSTPHTIRGEYISSVCRFLDLDPTHQSSSHRSPNGL
jgi:hypothetical protein